MMPTKEEEVSTRPLGEGLADQTLQPTKVSEWKKSPAEGLAGTLDSGFIVELPSGNVVRMVRNLSLPEMLKTGQIPNPLATIVQRTIDNRDPEQIMAAQDDPAALSQLIDLMNEVVASAIIEPAFDCPQKRQKKETVEQYTTRLENWEPEPGKISIWDMTYEDKIYLFAITQGAAADLARFRDQSEGAVPDVPTKQRVPVPTKRTNGTRPKKK